MKRYRLTESKLRNIVREAIINEIGDTPQGNFALNAVRGRRAAKRYRTNMGTRERAENDRVMGMAGDIAYKNYKEKPELGYDNPAGYYYGFQKGVDKYQNNESKLHEMIREAVESALSAEDYSNTEENLSALADYLNCDASEIEQTSNICFQTSDGQEWYVFNSLEDAEDYVMADYDAPRFMEDCWRDGQEFYDWLMANPRAAAYYDLKKVFPRMNGVDLFDDYDEETGEFVEREVDLSDYPELFTNEVDWEYVAEVVLKYDGPQWFLAGYDGEEVELWNGAVAYRYN